MEPKGLNIVEIAYSQEEHERLYVAMLPLVQLFSVAEYARRVPHAYDEEKYLEKMQAYAAAEFWKIARPEIKQQLIALGADKLDALVLHNEPERNDVQEQLERRGKSIPTSSEARPLGIEGNMMSDLLALAYTRILGGEITSLGQDLVRQYANSEQERPHKDGGDRPNRVDKSYPPKFIFLHAASSDAGKNPTGLYHNKGKEGYGFPPGLPFTEDAYPVGWDKPGSTLLINQNRVIHHRMDYDNPTAEKLPLPRWLQRTWLGELRYGMLGNPKERPGGWAAKQQQAMDALAYPVGDAVAPTLEYLREQSNRWLAAERSPGVSR